MLSLELGKIVVKVNTYSTSVGTSDAHLHTCAMKSGVPVISYTCRFYSGQRSCSGSETTLVTRRGCILCSLCTFVTFMTWLTYSFIFLLVFGPRHAKTCLRAHAGSLIRTFDVRKQNYLILQNITKTHLFKYIENFTTKN